MERNKDRNSQLLGAGALLAPDAAVSEDERFDRVSVRTYAHPGLGSRVVIRLVPDALAKGEDISLQHFGFGEARVRENVALARRRALGFPAWALVHDPDHGPLALEVMKGLRGEIKGVGIKPGHAKEAMEAIAKGLASEAPHLLPSFYEEAGRAFLREGNRHYATQFFGKARAAEKTYGLAVDEGERKESFLEFTLAGAVSTKALTEYARELTRLYDGERAYEHFLELLLRRARGGLPPWTSMAKDLERLVKAAGRDPEGEARRLMEELLETVSLNRAPHQFWKAYEPALASLFQGRPELGVRLLRILPQPPGEAKAEFITQWLSMLDRLGALALWEAKDPSLPPAGAWFTQMLDLSRHQDNPAAPDALFALLRRMAGLIRAEGVPVRLHTGNYSGYTDELEVDLCDLALELGVPVADPEEDVTLNLEGWVEALDGSKERPRDPRHLAADPRFAPLLRQGLQNVMAEEEFQRTARGKEAFHDIRGQWLADLLAPPPTLPGLAKALEGVGESTRVSLFEEFPEALPRLQALEVGSRLATTLRGGLLAELGWPELDEACSELDPRGEGKVRFAGTFPYLIVTDQMRALVVGPQGRALDHELRLPQGGSLTYLHFVDGQLLVAFRVKGADLKGYWSDRPQEVISLDFSGWPSLGLEGRQVPLPGGGVHLGGGALHPGDAQIPRKDASFISDGITLWRREYQRGSHVLVEIDPATGERGRASLPAFLEAYGTENKSLNLEDSDLFPAPEGLTASPLGLRDGLLGWRVRQADEKAVEWEGVDGRSYCGSLGEDREPPLALLSLPARDEPLPVGGVGYEDLDDLEYSYALWDPQSTMILSMAGAGDQAYGKGLPLVPPLAYWHLLRPRDQAGSKALARLSDEGASRLLAAALADLNGKREAFDQARQAMADILPSLTDGRLREAVLGVVAEAARLQGQRDELVRLRDPLIAPRETDPLAGKEGADGLSKMLGLLLDESWEAHGLLEHVRDLGAFFAHGQGKAIEECDVSWPQLIGSIGALAYFAPTVALSQGQREIVLRLLEVWAATPFATEPGRFRFLSCNLERSKLPFPLQGEGWGQGLGEFEGNRYFVSNIDMEEDTDVGRVLEYAPQGLFKVLPGATIESSHQAPEGPWWGSPERIQALVEVVRRRGARPFDREAAQSLVQRTGMSFGEAALLLAGLPNLRGWSKNFLPKELREELGLKVNEAYMARQTLSAMGQDKGRSLLDGAMPDDPEDLYRPLGQGPEDETSFIARLARSWERVMGKSIPIPAKLMEQLSKDLGSLMQPSDLISLLSNPASSPVLTTDGLWAVDDWGELENRGETAFDGQTLLAVVVLLAYLHAEMPVGHPLLAKVDQVAALARERLNSPGLLLAGPVVEGSKRKLQAFMEALGGEAFIPQGSERTEALAGRDTGELLALAEEDWETVYIAYRPSRVRDWEVLHKLGTLWDEEEWMARAAQMLLSPDFGEVIKRLSRPPLAEGSWEADPRRSAPDLVRQVSQARGLSEEGATLYLQLLALTRPTDRRLQEINGWKPAVLRQAGQELLEAGLVVQAKRSRAGRTLFLPGDWEPLKAPALPLEAWKLPLYGVSRPSKAKALLFPLRVLVPLMPLHRIFRRAWERVEAGEGPGQEGAGR